ncbi:MAG: rhomboid family intramembrane serine protease [Gaiellaceae bacterium MAG52_C11]|nr:rhomboid family intramembrane serine protease [Candidatus Gaiellasilicea maunaloa]
MAETLTCYRHPNRETGVSCSECGRGICPDCMRFAPVGIRCPDHAGNQKVVRGVPRPSTAKLLTRGGEGAVTRALIGINVAVYLLTLAAGASINGVGGRVYEEGVLFGPLVAEGEWWRLLTSTFMHYGPFHLLMNMYSLYLLGGALEGALGRVRYVALYLVSGLAGAAGALLLSPNSLTLGASGAIFGVIGAIFILERQGLRVFPGSVVGLLVANLAFTFLFARFISVGGHLGGLAGGALAALALSRFGRGHAAYGKPGLIGLAGLAGVAVASVAISYFSVMS